MPVTENKTRINYKLWIVLGICAVALFLRYDCLNNRPWWGDEELQYTNVKGEGEFEGKLRPFWAKIHYISGDHSAFPGEYVLTFPFVQVFDRNKWGVAIPHILATILGFYFLYRLSQQYLRTLLGYFIAFSIVGMNTNLIFHSFEFRPYAVLPTLYLANIYLFNDLVPNFNKASFQKKFWVGVYIVLSMSYHAYSVLILGLPLMYQVFVHRRVGWQYYIKESFVKYFAACFVLAMALWAWFASGNNFGVMPNIREQTIVDTFQYIPNPVHEPLGFLKGVLGNLIGFKWLYPFLLGMIALGLPHKQRLEQWLFFLTLIVLPLALILVFDILTIYWFLQRQFVWIIPVFALFLGWCADTIFLLFKSSKRGQT